MQIKNEREKKCYRFDVELIVNRSLIDLFLISFCQQIRFLSIAANEMAISSFVFGRSKLNEKKKRNRKQSLKRQIILK